MLKEKLHFDLRNEAQVRANRNYGRQQSGIFLVRSTGARVIETPKGVDLVFSSRGRVNRFVDDLVFQVHRGANLFEVAEKLGRGGTRLTKDLVQFLTNHPTVPYQQEYWTPGEIPETPEGEMRLHFQPRQVRKDGRTMGLVFASTDLAVGTLLDLLPVSSAFGRRESTWTRSTLLKDLQLDFRREDRKALLNAIHDSGKPFAARKRAWEEVHWLGAQAFADGAY